MFSRGDPVFSDEYSEPDYKLPVETRLIKYLRLWREDRGAVIYTGESVWSALSLVVEWFLCECLAYSPEKEVGGWWSDGVSGLRIAQTGPESFDLLGVTWIGSPGRTPFHIEAHLDPGSDDLLARCVLRIGARDDDGRPLLYDRKTTCRDILDQRPTTDTGWATAFELTPNGGAEPKNE